MCLKKEVHPTVRSSVWGQTRTKVRCCVGLGPCLRTKLGQPLLLAAALQRRDEQRKVLHAPPPFGLLAQVSASWGHRWGRGIDGGPSNPEQYHLSIGGGQVYLLSSLPTCLFIRPRLRRPLFILMWSGWSSWWWHGVDYAVPTVTYSKDAGEGVHCCPWSVDDRPACCTSSTLAVSWCEGSRARACGDVYSTRRVWATRGFLRWCNNIGTIWDESADHRCFVSVLNITLWEITCRSL